MIGPVLQQEAESLNQTPQEELSLADQTLLLEEVAATVKALTAVNLTAARTAANQESRCVLESHMTCLFVRLAADCCPPSTPPPQPGPVPPSHRTHPLPFGTIRS